MNATFYEFIKIDIVKRELCLIMSY
jgi:hypothetical protein